MIYAYCGACWETVQHPTLNKSCGQVGDVAPRLAQKIKMTQESLCEWLTIAVSRTQKGGWNSPITQSTWLPTLTCQSSQVTDGPADVCAATPPRAPSKAARGRVWSSCLLLESKNTDAYTQQNERPIAAERVYEPYFSVIGLLDGRLHTHTLSLSLPSWRPVHCAALCRNRCIDMVIRQRSFFLLM